MELETYKAFVKKERKSYFSDDKPYDLIYRQFEQSGLTEKPINYFFENASQIIESIREKAWQEFQDKEQAFTEKMLSALYSESDINQMTGLEAIAWFVRKFPNQMYNLNLSNTQSRRSRAGKEFEAIIELILIGADIPMDSQGNIGKKFFVDKGLGKMVDIVSPGSLEYELKKRDTVLISAKTSLRERWQEVSDEMGRTGAREMFLVTLDENISKEVIENLYDNNIQIVTTKNLKERKYNTFNNVISFENLMTILQETAIKWTDYPYTPEAKSSICTILEKQKKKHKHHLFVSNYYQRYIDKFSN